MTPRRAVFHDLPAAAFPIILEFFKVIDTDGVKVVHRIDIPGPGVIDVPRLVGDDGVKVWVRVTYANGVVQEHVPD